MPTIVQSLLLLHLMFMTRVLAKDLWILRHGQATHNPRAEAAKDAGCTMAEFFRLMREDDSIDSELTELGRQQAADVHRADYWQRHAVDLVVASPLSRAIQTANLALPLVSNRILCEHWREVNGELLNAQRRTKTELRQRYPEWNLQYLEHEEDVHWTHQLESFAVCCERGYQGLRWIAGREESRILLVAHGGILRQVMNEHDHVRVEDGRTETNGRASAARFHNCELRRYRLREESSMLVLTEVDLDAAPMEVDGKCAEST